MSNYVYGSIDGFHLSYEHAQGMGQRLRVDMPMIILNAIRLRGHCCTLLELHEYYRRNVLKHEDTIISEPVLSSKQMILALEFYLQMDDLFYMKTCSFGGAQPRFDIEGLFCGAAEPEARYSMKPCRNLFCLCCHPYNQPNKTHEGSDPTDKSLLTSNLVHNVDPYEV